jgi:uncharacterized protein YacL
VAGMTFLYGALVIGFLVKLLVACVLGGITFLIAARLIGLITGTVMHSLGFRVRPRGRFKPTLAQ